MKTYWALTFVAGGFWATETTDKRGWDDLSYAIGVGKAMMADAFQWQTEGETVKISEKCAQELPVGKFVRFDVVEDMNGDDHNAVIWAFDFRSAAFDVETGEYLGEMR